MKPTADIVIIGAGAIGCSTAYHLAKAGIRDVAVVEMGQVGSGSSSKSASLLTMQFTDNELTARMVLYSYARYMEFEAELGDPIDFRKNGYLAVAGSDLAEGLRERARLHHRMGIASEVLSPADIQARYPLVDVSDVAVGIWGPDDGSLDAHMVLWGYMKGARALGAKLHEGVRATGLRTEGGRVTGVDTTDGPISAPIVVNAAGPWAGEVGRWAGIDVPLRNSERTIVVSGPFPRFPSDWPHIVDETLGCYCQPEMAGVLMGYGARPATSMDPKPTLDHIEEVITRVAHRVPALGEASLLTSWTGIRPLTPDGLPILGPVPGLDGFLLNAGWGGMGILQAPVAGQLLAEYVTTGSTTTVELEPLRIERFSR